MSEGYQQHLAWVAQRRDNLRQLLAELFPVKCELGLEIGCGHGHWLNGYASTRPDHRFLGVDLIADRIDRANRKRERAGVVNVDFIKAEAMELLDLLPEHVVLTEVFVLFPDPWPKKRHWKNRLFCESFLEELGKRCGEGVRCHFRTDHAGYFEWAEEIASQTKTWSRIDESNWPFELETVFQSKADSYQSLILVKL